MDPMDERLSVAPMMEWTDPHWRRLARIITKRTVLYTEMVVDDTIIHSPNLDFYFGRGIEEEPSVIQVGGHDPENLGKACEIVQKYGGGYGEVNLNCGCPSQRVAQRCFGAKLMLEPELVREIVHSMQRRLSVPVTVKCRIGVDDFDSYEELTRFIMAARLGGARKFIIHARKCLLDGLSPKQNRDVPPLHYDIPHRLVQEFPDLRFIINGGVTTLSQANVHLAPYTHTPCTSCTPQHQPNLSKSIFAKLHKTTGGFIPELGSDPLNPTTVMPAVHGVMIGRAAYSNPMILATADSEIFGQPDPCLSRRQVLDQYIDYCEWVQSDQGPKYITTKGDVKTPTTMQMLNAMRSIMHGLPRNARFRTGLNDQYMERLKALGEGGGNPDVREVIESACLVMRDEDLDRVLGNPLAKDDTLKTYSARSKDTAVDTAADAVAAAVDTAAADAAAADTDTAAAIDTVDTATGAIASLALDTPAVI
ncbi:hypothetical protein B484DRAFT_453542 [Ochromonadaceae sp. CCMP2298]|nr:hypothetical protein B484DRAFT_453542 [Ochromonadaceae sp. CCMP2298]